jgi:hypothetical protein
MQIAVNTGEREVGWIVPAAMDLWNDVFDMQRCQRGIILG